MKLPEIYQRLSDDNIFARIQTARARLGDSLVILGHHYQSDQVIQFADVRGDSLELSRIAASQKKAGHIVFCGVDFMAETAAMLCEPYQKVLLPAMESSCPMALMANVEDATYAWRRLSVVWDEVNMIPVTYQNSSADLKAFCGRHGGAVCTSANAQAVFRWAFDQGKRIVFFPDRWLGTNTALALGLTFAQIAVWDPSLPDGGVSQPGEAKVVVWDGYCHVHTRFSVEHVETARRTYPDAVVIVHPECPTPVVQAADLNGSTSFILRQVEQAKAGSTFVIGTECNMVRRLAHEHPTKTVAPLVESFCGAMALTTPAHLLYVLDGLLEGQMIGEISVPSEIKEWANIALARMLSI